VLIGTAFLLCARYHRALRWEFERREAQNMPALLDRVHNHNLDPSLGSFLHSLLATTGYNFLHIGKGSGIVEVWIACWAVKKGGLENRDVS